MKTSISISIATFIGLGLAGVVGCGDSGDTGTGGGGTTSTTSASGGATGSGGSTSVTTGTGGTTTGTGGSGTGGSAPTHCDYSGCEACKAQNCNVVDNPCNDDPTNACEPAQEYWRKCVCASAGDATASAACDADFVAVDSTLAQPIIDCVRTNCTECIVLGEESTPPPVACPIAHPDCILCSQVDCHDAVTACSADASCAPALNNVGMCICQAQLGTGTVQACLTTFQTAGGSLADDVVSCLATSCSTECPL